MSLLQKASIITTPTAYAEDYLYSIKPAYALGAELIPNGKFEENTNGWAVNNANATFVRQTDSTALFTSTSFAYVRLNPPLTLIKSKYRVAFDVLSFEGTLSNVHIGLGTSGNTVTTTGSYSYDYDASGGSTEFQIRPNSGGTGSIKIDNISVKQIIEADFDFDRNSTGTRVNEDYLIEDVPYNAINFSEDFTQWSLNGDSVVLQDETYLGRPIYKLTEASSSTLGVHQTRTGNIAGSPYTISLIAKKDTSSFIRLRFGSPINKNVDFNLDTGVVTSESSGVTGAIQNIGNGFYQLSSVLASLTNATISYAIYTSNGSVFITSAQMVKGDKLKDYLKTTDRLDIPRIDYTNGEPSILLERQSSNLCTHSVDFATGVSSGSFTLGSSSTLTYVSNIQAPDGTMGVYRLTNAATSGTFLSFYTGNSKNVSVYVKAVDVNKDNQFSLFKSSGSPSASSVFTASNRWERFDFEYAQSSGNTGINNEGDSYVSDVYIWGAQVEDANSYATSLIHTSGSAVTRSADSVRNAGNSDLISNSEGVLYAELARTSDNGNYELIAISSGVADYQNIVALGFDANNNEIWYRAKLGNTDLIIAVGAEVRPQNEFFKIAVKYKSGDSKVYLNGKMIDSTTTTASTSVAFTRLDLAFFNLYNFYGKLKNVTVFKEALSDEELEKLTGYNNHELYMNYYNRLSYLGLAEEYNVESDINNYIL